MVTCSPALRFQRETERDEKKGQREERERDKGDERG
jgi:hypothetical protein